jgi:hypothetical protein
MNNRLTASVIVAAIIAVPFTGVLLPALLAACTATWAVHNWNCSVSS